MFIDEAHLIFNEASKALLSQIESIVKLIRSKGVGLYFVTQNPTDVPEAVLGQLGLKVQHALRAFTAKDRKAIKLTAQNYPDTEFYDTADVLTSLGIGEALVSALDEKGKPTPLAATMMRAPMSRMDILSDIELSGLLGKSKLAKKYNQDIDRESAYEMLNKKIEIAEAEEAKEKARLEKEKLENSERKQRTSRSRSRSTRQNPIIKVLTSPTVIRSVLGILTKLFK
jgi:DNA helicase HerA-like ATPase